MHYFIYQVVLKYLNFSTNSCSRVASFCTNIVHHECMNCVSCFLIRSVPNCQRIGFKFGAEPEGKRLGNRFCRGSKMGWYFCCMINELYAWLRVRVLDAMFGYQKYFLYQLWWYELSWYWYDVVKLIHYFADLGALSNYKIHFFCYERLCKEHYVLWLVQFMLCALQFELEGVGVLMRVRV